MKKRLLSVLVFALAVSAGAAFVLYQLIASKVKAGGPSAPAAPRTVKVFVAAHDLELGALIQEKDLKIQEYIAPPSGSITKKEDIVGRGVSNPIHEDAPFFEPSLAPKGAGAGFASIIPKGMRAFAIHVNDVVGVAGFAVAGMHVDVLVSGSPVDSFTGESSGSVSRTLLQNIEVLSAGQNFQKDAEGKPYLVQVVNLLVNPAQAEIMSLAADQKIQLVLRNPADHEVVATRGAATANLFDGSSSRLAGPAVAASQTLPHMPLVHAAKIPATAAAMPQAAAPVLAAPVNAPVPAPALPVTVEVFAGSHRTATTFGETPGNPK